MKIKKALALLLVVTLFSLCFVTPADVHAQETQAQKNTASSQSDVVVPAESDFEYILSPKSNPKWALVTKYKGTDSRIAIPETLGGLPVRVLSEKVFTGCNTLTYVYIPAHVTSVSGLTFAECFSLEEIEVDPLHQNYVSEDGILFNSDKTSVVAFPNAKGGEYTVPEGVITIGSYAFSGAYRLTKVNMYNTLSAIGAGAFYNCDALEEIRLSDCLKSLGQKALASCESLRELHLPASLSIIGTDALLGDMGSNDDKYYYFTNGIYCVKDSFAYDYVYKLGIRSPYLATESRTLTDIKSGISIVDTNNTLPLDKDFLLTVTPLEADAFSSLLPVRYNDILSYDISLVSDGANYSPVSSVIIRFGKLPENTIVSTVKVYRTSGSNAFDLIRSPHTPFVAAQTKKLGTFTLINNKDFSKKGDIDGDGIVTSYDARFALCIAAELVPDITDEQKATADTDGKSGIATSDACEILRYAAGIVA